LYQQSSGGLLTYVVVERGSRKKGLARQMIGRAVTLLESKARERGRPLRAVFAEVHNPHRPQPGALDPYARVNLMYRLGARHVPIPYVQPALRKNPVRARAPLLVPFPPDQYPPTPT